MPTVRKIVRDLLKHNPDDVLCVVIWCKDDILERAIERDMTITDKQANGILEDMYHEQDSTIGISWVNVDNYLDILKNE